MNRTLSPNLSKDEANKPHRMVPERPNGIARVLIQIEGSETPVWRRILIDETTPVADLSEIARVSMGWPEEAVGTQSIGFDSPTPERRRKRQLPLDHPFAFRLAGWIHTVTVEARIDREESAYPLCLEGKGERPSARGYESHREKRAKKQNTARAAEAQATQPVLFETLKERLQLRAAEVNERFREQQGYSALDEDPTVECRKRPN